MRLAKEKYRYKLVMGVFVLKILYLIFGNGFDFFKQYNITMFKGDALDYLTYAVNFVDKGEYTLNGTVDGVTEYVYRMPGMAFILVPLMYLFSFSIAIKLFVLLQIALASIAAVMLYQFLEERFSIKWLSYPVLFFFSFGVYINNYNASVLSETISQSLFIVITCFFLRKDKFTVNREFLLISLLFSWLFFLRPFLIVFLPLLCFKLTDFGAFKKGINSFFKANAAVVLFLTVVLLSDAAWIFRNYLKTNKFVPLEYSVKPEKLKFMKECIPPLYDYIRHFGGNQYATPYDRKTSHYLWFYPDRSLLKKGFSRPDNSIFPKVVFNDGITIDSLTRIRQLIDSTLSYKAGSPQRQKYFAEYLSSIRRADNAVLRHTGFVDHVIFRKGSFLRFVLQPIDESEAFVSWGKPGQVLIFLNKALNFFFITLMLVLFCFIGIWNSSAVKTYYFLLFPALFLLFMFIGYYNIKEERELFSYYPAFLIFGCSALKWIYEKIGKLKESKHSLT